MNIKNIILPVIAVTAILLNSCGGNSEKKNETKAGDYNLEVEKSISGPFSESFEVTNAVLKISDETFGSKLLVEVKRTSSSLPVDANDADVCGSSSGKSSEWCISADVLGENNLPISTNLDKYGYDSFEKALTLKENETIWLEFSTGYGDELKNEPSKAKKVKLTSSAQKQGGSSVSSSNDYDTDNDVFASSGSENWDKMLDDYEAYVDKYLDFLKKSQKGDMSALQEYPALMEKAENLEKSMKKAQDDNKLSASQIKRMTKIQTKMINAAADMY